MAEYVPVGEGMYEKVDRWEAGLRVPVTTGECIDENTYQEMMRRRQQEAADNMVKSSPNQHRLRDRTGLSKYGAVAVGGSLIKVS